MMAFFGARITRCKPPFPARVADAATKLLETCRLGKHLNGPRFPLAPFDGAEIDSFALQNRSKPLHKPSKHRHFLQNSLKPHLVRPDVAGWASGGLGLEGFGDWRA